MFFVIFFLTFSMLIHINISYYSNIHVNLKELPKGLEICPNNGKILKNNMVSNYSKLPISAKNILEKKIENLLTTQNLTKSDFSKGINENLKSGLYVYFTMNILTPS